MLCLIFVGTALNSVDRANLSVAAPLLKQTFGLDAVDLGYVFSAYAWTYMLCNLPGGLPICRAG